ncbi:diguanylate cyclase domain-containing protein [Vibrio sp. SCSIO 43137]|uniref:diguanylate cyclase domain-containing protein n=1 Tax=Vibrio sp. SCSIO 43137 TaxID=3021011 RepID=UPI002306DDD7|nr:diguanylate cyclase [Vibrio sp. SCSIO 43137]WCE32598.1 diguanylate cyclase [Vibrio sp. SCSIO 43137]
MFKESCLNNAKRILAILAAGLFCMAIWWQLSSWYQSTLADNQSEKVRIELDRFTYDLASTIQSRENLLNALASYVETDIANAGFYSDKRAETFMAGLYTSTAGMRNFAIAPEGKISLVYPLAGNEEALGHDLLTDPSQGVSDVSNKAIKTRQIAYSEPYELRQGGLGVVLRKAVYSDSGFWGLVAMVMDIIPVIEDAGLTAKSGGLNIAIRDSKGSIFYGSEEVFDNAQASSQVSLTDGSWEIAATSIGIGSLDNKLLTFKLVLAGTLILLAGLGVFLLPAANNKQDLLYSSQTFFEHLTRIPNQTGSKHSRAPNWMSPLMTSIAIVAIVVGFYRYVEQSDSNVQQHNFTQLLSTLNSDIEAKLNTDREYLQLIAEELAQENLDPDSYQLRVSSYVNDHPGLINVTWADDEFVIRHTAPLEGNSQVIGLQLLLPEPKRASRLAYNSGQPAYTKPFTVIQGKPAFEVYVPIIYQNQFKGTLGGVYSIKKLMESLIKKTPELSEYRLELLDSAGNSYFRSELTDYNIAFSKTVPVKPVGGNLWIKLSSYQKGPSSNMQMLMLFSILLAAGLVTSIWVQYRESYRHWQISKELHQSQQHFSAVATASPAAIVIISQKTAKILYANHQANKLFSHIDNSIIGWNSDDLYADNKDRQLFFASVAEHSQVEGLEQRLIKAGGETFWGSLSGRLVRHDNEAVLVACIFDLSERKRYEDQLYTQAHYDNLTGLPNRRLAFEKLDVAVNKARSDGQKVAILYIDIDLFKNINDSYGHIVGDQVLIEFADRLLDSVRGQDTVARLAGDEFMIILPDQADRAGAKLVAEKIVSSCAQPVIADENQVAVSVSIGISLYPDDADDNNRMIKNADTAMYQSKKQGRNQYYFYQ